MEPPGTCNADKESTPCGATAGIRDGMRKSHLKRDIEHLLQKHQSDVSACLDGWLQQCNGDVLTIPFQGNRVEKREALETQRLLTVVPTDAPSKQNSREVIQVVPAQKEKEKEWVSTKSPMFKHGKTKAEKGMIEKTIADGPKKDKTRKRVSDQIFAERRDEAAQNLSILQRFTTSSYYEVTSCGLIFLNAIFIGLECQVMATRAANDAAQGLTVREDTPTVFYVFGLLFTIFFTIELSLRWTADGFLQFFQSPDVAWNILDIVIVGFGVLDTFLEIIMSATSESGSGGRQERLTSNVSVIRVLRVVRIVRVAKVIRVMRFFRELRIMLYSILGSLKSLLWVMLILAMMFYVFGICFTVAATMKMSAATRTDDLFVYFGTLDKSILSLYMSMSGGNDWAVYYDALAGLNAQYRLIFILFITFSVFAVVNIVTGVFVDTAFSANATDRQVVVMEELEAKKAYLSSMKTIFEEMDTDGTGVLTLQEFETRLDDERVIAYFHALKLDVSDARTLFALLDYDHSEEVSVDEFLSGCYKLQGESRSLDMKIMQCEMRYVKEGFNQIESDLAELLECLRGPPPSPRIQGNQELAHNTCGTESK